MLTTPLVRAEEVAELLSIKTSTVYELSRRRDPLPSVRIGRSKRFDRRAVARWVQAYAAPEKRPKQLVCTTAGKVSAERSPNTLC